MNARQIMYVLSSFCGVIPKEVTAEQRERFRRILRRNRSKYMPHNGKQECLRRGLQIEKGFIHRYGN